MHELGSPANLVASTPVGASGIAPRSGSFGWRGAGWPVGSRACDGVSDAWELLAAQTTHRAPPPRRWEAPMLAVWAIEWLTIRGKEGWRPSGVLFRSIGQLSARPALLLAFVRGPYFRPSVSRGTLERLYSGGTELGLRSEAARLRGRRKSSRRSPSRARRIYERRAMASKGYALGLLGRQPPPRVAMSPPRGASAAPAHACLVVVVAPCCVREGLLRRARLNGVPCLGDGGRGCVHRAHAGRRLSHRPPRQPHRRSHKCRRPRRAHIALLTAGAQVL